MKSLGLIAGLAGLVMAGTANAATIYDTLTGQSVVGSTLLQSGLKFKSPAGVDFTAAYEETVQSVVLGLSNNVATSNTGSVIVYLVQSNPQNSGLPQSSGLTLSNPVYLGTIQDSLITSTTFQTYTLNTNATIGAGTWWLELVDAADPNNKYGNANSVHTTIKWDAIATGSPGTTGLPSSGFYTSGTDSTGTSIVGGVSSQVGPSPAMASANGSTIFMAQINAPEPASLTLIGAGLVGLGMSRRRKVRKTV